VPGFFRKVADRQAFPRLFSGDPGGFEAFERVKLMRSSFYTQISSVKFEPVMAIIINFEKPPVITINFERYF